MEILMKLKCSPSTSSHGNSTATLKVVDHHHQLTQQHAALPPQATTASATAPPPPPPSLVRLPTQTSINYSSSSPMPPMAVHAMPRMPTTARSCMNYTKPMECCNAGVNPQEAELYDLQWREQQGRRRVTYEVAMQRPPPPSCCANIPDSNIYESPACCSGTACRLPGCGATPPMAALPPPPPPTQPQPPPLLHQAPTLQPPPLAYPMTSAAEDAFDSSGMSADYNTHYEYHEPEENFVSIEDTNIKNLLMKIGREYAEEKKEREQAANERTKRRANNVRVMEKDQPVIFEIIELDDEDDRQEVRQECRTEAGNSTQKTINEQQHTLEHDGLKIMKAPAAGRGKPKTTRMKSPSISLIPKSPSPKPAEGATPPPQQQEKNKSSKERIIAHIDLSDSSDSEVDQSAEQIGKHKNQIQEVAFESTVDDAGDDDDSDELTYAAAAVSCELECEDDDNGVVVVGNSNNMPRSHANADDDVVILNSDDENAAEYIVPHEKVVERQWDDYERREKCRQFFECYLCGKKVQSSYNLRRHMMIHTGERPFACDMCDRRFREFSDLKKHRRRHANEANFVCMVCRVKTPTLYDPTRCTDCDSKMSALIAAMPPQLTTSPATSTSDNVQTPPMGAATTTTRQPPPPLPPQLTAKPTLVTNLREINTTTFAGNTTTNNNNRIGTLSSPGFIQQHSTVKTNVPPKRPNSNTTFQSTDTMPSLVPINAPITVNKTVNKNAQLLLDNVPSVQRSNYNQTTMAAGVITRKEFACPLCQRAFGTRHNLKRHFMIHTGEKPFSCNKCRKPFREYSTLKKHMVTHQRDRYYKCLRCPQQYRDYLDYIEHKKIHAKDSGGDDGIHNDEDPDDDDDDDEYEGNFDQQHLSSSSSASSPQKRAKIHYDSSEDNSSMEDCWLECCECKQRYTDIDSYTQHLKEHDPAVHLYECYICKKTFDKRDQLVEHVGACKVELRETALSQRAKCFN